MTQEPELFFTRLIGSVPSALFVLVRKATADKVLERLKGEGGTVMKTSLDHTKEAALQAALAEAKAAVPAKLE